MQDQPLIALEGIFKRFGSTQALKDVSLSVRGGELVGLIGHNGAGKSTAMRTIAGEYHPDSGIIRVRGQDVTHVLTPARALKLGIRTVYQELDLPGNLRVGEATQYAAPNAVGRGIKWRARAERLIMDKLEEIFPGSGISPGDRIERLSISCRQMTAIALVALWSREELATCLILDEPTSSLDAVSAKRLYAWLRKEAPSRQLAVIVSTHKLNEVIDELDRAYVMVNGAIAAEQMMSGATRSSLVSAMQTGGKSKKDVSESIEIPSVGAPKREGIGSIAVNRYADEVISVDEFGVLSGEIVGLGGLEGQGQKHFLRVLLGSRGKIERDAIRIVGRRAFVSGDRGVEGVFPLWDLEANMSIASLGDICRFGLVSNSLERQLASRWHSTLRVKGALEDPITSLSGGTQQKALVGRALAYMPNVLLLDDPTRGVDEDTKLEILSFVRGQAQSGAAVLWYSTETMELQRCERVCVMRGGRIVDTLFTKDCDAKTFEDRVLGASFLV